MVGQHSGNQPQLFYYNLNLEERVPHNHVLRKKITLSSGKTTPSGYPLIVLNPNPGSSERIM